MNMLSFQLLLWILIGCTAARAVYLVWKWGRDAGAWRKDGRARAQDALPPIGREFLDAQARLGRLKRPSDGTTALPDHATLLVAGASSSPQDDARQRATVDHVSRSSEADATWSRTPTMRSLDRAQLMLRTVQAGFNTSFRSMLRWFGGPSLLILILTVLGLRVWWTWERGQDLPLLPQAQRITEEIQGALLKQTTFISDASPAEVRTFYRQTLPQRGWRYCGTQETAGCTNLVRLIDGSGAGVDVYRRLDELDKFGPSIEIKAVRNTLGETYIVIWEANRYPRLWE